MIKVFDFFSGCGGTSKGFQQAGMETVFAIDNDAYAANTFVNNFDGAELLEELHVDPPFPQTSFLMKSIDEVLTEELAPLVNAMREQNHPLLFSGCAPCQPFSTQRTNRPEQDDRITLLAEFQRFVEHFLPEFVFVENVPGMQNVAGQEGPFEDFLFMLENLGYFVSYRVVFAQRYGIPQRRKRLILIASRLGPIELPAETHGPEADLPYSTPREWIGDLPSIKAGETHNTIPNHQSSALSKLNLRRIMATPVGGDRLDWPEDLRLACHTNGYTGHSDVYGRMKWDELSNCLTTRCNGLSNGRFGHPEQHRAISGREAASIQTFPRDFVFTGGVSIVAKQIGNAVPVLLAEKFGENFYTHLARYPQDNIDG